MEAIKKPLLVGAGWVFVCLGVLGIIMPLFPTTPFLLLAIWAFSKSSPELADRIRNHRVAGPFIRDWQDNGVIPLKAKLLAIAMMMAMVAYLHFGAHAPWWGTGLAAAVLLAIAIFIVTRPSRAPGA